MKVAETLILILQVVILGVLLSTFTGCSSMKPYSASGNYDIQYGEQLPDPSTPNV